MLSFIKFVLRFFSKLVFFVKTVDIENIPEKGAVILAVNHTSMWDPVVLVPQVKRKMRVMAKKELFDIKPLVPILKVAHAFPVNRGATDIGAIKNALKTLKDGEIFTIFPAGTRVDNEEGAEAKSGVALIASRANAPVIPVAIRGGFKPFRRVTIYFGKPIVPELNDGKKMSGEELKAFADEIMNKINELGK